MKDVDAIIKIVTAIVQIGFWGTLGTIAVLTYRRARDTLLQPMKTEVFKLQIAEVGELLKIFKGKGEVELAHQAGLDALLALNALEMYDDYAAQFFDVTKDESKRPYNRRNCPQSLMHVSGIALVEEAREPPPPVVPAPDPRVRAALWHDYERLEIRLPRSFVEANERLQTLAQSPILPQECTQLIDEFLGAVSENASIASDAIVAAAKDMPRQFPTLEALQTSKGEVSWVHNMYVRKAKPLLPHALAITEFIRRHFGIEGLGIGVPPPKQLGP